MRFILVLLFLFVLIPGFSCQSEDSLKVDYRRIFSLCLDANVQKALHLLPGGQNVISSDRKVIQKFDERFRGETDRSDYLEKHSSKIDSLLFIFHKYWRSSLLDTAGQYDQSLTSNLNDFFDTTATDIGSLKTRFSAYIRSQKMFATNGIGRTGKLFDLLAWKNQTDTTYTFKIHNEEIKVRVVLMKEFVTLGWEEYATFGKLYPSGWATSGALYCVADSYDQKSERFLISYLAHEGRHFKDYAAFPGLTSKDLEYRAKLTELSMAKETLFALIQFFIANSNKNSPNGHSVANFQVVSDMSKVLFKKDFERDIEVWKKVSAKDINNAAYRIFINDSKSRK